MLVLGMTWTQIWDVRERDYSSAALRQVRLLLPLPPRFVTASDSQAMNNLYEYSSIALAAEPSVYTVCGWTNCPSYSTAMKPVVGPVMTDNWLVWVGWQQTGTCHWVMAAARDDRTADSADGVRVQSQDDFFVAVPSASVALDWDDIWGQTAGRNFSRFLSSLQLLG